MSLYTELFLNTRSRVKKFECFKISHPNFTKAYYIVRNKPGGLTAVVEGVPTQFDYYPLQKTEQPTKADLDFAIQIDLGDLGEVVSMELDAVEAADGFMIKPSLTYWMFRSDDLMTPRLGPITLEIPEFPMTREGTSFIAQAPALNASRTGEIYTAARFPMLAGFR
ncbi:MAG TPA: hypothetical protein VHZ78_08535 [Rhizomicrobium sp.]|jgi:hypothetical protein|nr:hypothetical protein [Rhizomicrobium sp.]